MLYEVITLDSVIQAFRLAEEVLLPCMVVLEANFISHFMEPVEVPAQQDVDRFLPPVDIPQRFDVDNPSYVGAVVSQSQYRDFKQLSQEAMYFALEAAAKVDQAFGSFFGRSYGLVEAQDFVITSYSIHYTKLYELPHSD